MLLWPLFTGHAAGTDNEFEVRVETRGELLIVDGNVTINASQKETWDVLTDFDHMGRFMSDLTMSRIVSAPSDHTMIVEQRGALRYGPFSVGFEALRLNELDPLRSIRSSLISGTFKRFDGTTTLVGDNEMTRISYHAEAIPNRWIPPVIGPLMVRSEAREKFRELRDEILRRKQLESTKELPE